ncbi:MAG TPA: MOSC domain-containing protein, partial [Methanobacterium sp.]|nr:MOSC domain-containing protein [Methanobacterium sp.]
MTDMQVIAVNTSENKHEKKLNRNDVVISKNYGIIGDAHGDSGTHRQISLLAIESIEKMRKMGLNVNPGDFAENITTKGINLLSISIGDKISMGVDVLLQVTQIGKECQQPCAIGQQVGECVMPTEGIFARVLKGGKVKIGD